LEISNPESGRRKNTWKYQIPNRDSVKTLGNIKSQIVTAQKHLEISNPKSGQRKNTWKYQIPNWDGAKHLFSQQNNDF